MLVQLLLDVTVIFIHANTKTCCNTEFDIAADRHCTKKKFPINDFFSKWDQIRNFLRIWSHLLKKSIMENFIFCPLQAACLQEPEFHLFPLEISHSQHSVMKWECPP